MGIDYIYVNHSKKQYFDIGLFGESCRSRCAGFGFGSRALSLLISDQGSWNCDSIEMVDDVSDKSLLISSNYTKINIEAELLILDVDGIENFKNLYEESEFDFSTFSHLCLYAMILKRPEVIELLDEKYGRGGWQKQYKNNYSEHTIRMELSIYEAQGRNIILFGK
ncbi:hypothetical protein KKA14_03510 [bacterium]|nr:hypothetical protein [bacterium]